MKTLALALADDVTDEMLLSSLRQGDQIAYTALWRRHVTAALRLGNRLVPGQAEDLVSESFLAVYQQVAVVGGGPTAAFRAYLFTVMRNTAMRWQREGHAVVSVAELGFLDQLADQQEPSTLDLLERESTSAELLDALSTLPQRWQRILWLSEVEDASRAEIAQDLGIKPNAVSALQRRARSGLRMNWLTRRIPTGLRDNPLHVARLLPRLIVDGRADGIARQVSTHLAECATCARLDVELRAEHGQMRKVTLSLAGFAALGGTIPAMAPMTAIGAAAVIGSIGLIGAGAAASIGLLVAGVALTTGIWLPGSSNVPAHPPAPNTSSSDSTKSGSTLADEQPGPESVEQQATPSVTIAPTLGRGNTDAAMPLVVFDDNNYEPPRPPVAQPPGSLPLPSDQPPTQYQAGLTTPRISNSKIAPVIGGTTRPGSTIAVELTTQPDAFSDAPAPTQYIAVVAADGTWAFDFRPLVPDRVGTYDYAVWAFTDDETSAPETGQFVVSAPTVTGFEGLMPFEMVDISEASTTGIVFTVTGPEQGNICLDSVYAGQWATIPLDMAGAATQRIRFLTGGSYYLTFRACEGEYRGPAVELFVDVDDPANPVFGPWGPDPAETQIALSEV